MSRRNREIIFPILAVVTPFAEACKREGFAVRVENSCTSSGSAYVFVFVGTWPEIKVRVSNHDASRRTRFFARWREPDFDIRVPLDRWQHVFEQVKAVARKLAA